MWLSLCDTEPTVHTSVVRKLVIIPTVCKGAPRRITPGAGRTKSPGGQRNADSPRDLGWARPAAQRTWHTLGNSCILSFDHLCPLGLFSISCCQENQRTGSRPMLESAIKFVESPFGATTNHPPAANGAWVPVEGFSAFPVIYHIRLAVFEFPVSLVS